MQQPFSFVLARRRAVPLLLACAAGIFLLLRMRRGYYYLSFGDEVEHVIGARVLNAGGRLYRDFIDEHGPLPYAVAQLVDLVTGGSHPAWVRLMPMLSAAGMIASVALSRCLCGTGERLLAVALLMSMLASIWIVQGLCLYDYQLLAGACLVVAAALDAAPAWTGRAAPAPACAAAGAAYVLSGFVAYSYIPAAVLLCASGRLATPGQPRGWCALGLGAGAACLLIAGWSARYLDPVGYVAFHLYMN